MAKSASGRCVHCLEHVDALTADHLFPRSWYPTTTPITLEKLKFPACGPCNNEYGRLEEDLRLLLAACVDPKSVAAAGIWAKACDSIDPDKARNGLLIRPDLSMIYAAYFTHTSWKNFFTRSGDFSNDCMCAVAAAFNFALVRTGTFV